MTDSEHDRVHEAFADLTGQLEDAVLIAVQGQCARTSDEVRWCIDTLAVAVGGLSASLENLRGQLK